MTELAQKVWYGRVLYLGPFDTVEIKKNWGSN